jgi:hypothetical protein
MSPKKPARIVFPPRAFTVGEAVAHGVTAKRLRARDLTTPFHGIRLRDPMTSMLASDSA